jgi:putative SOS response-associated peptidase YedK
VCGRFTLTTRPEVVAREFELASVPELAPRFNVAPSQPVATVWQPPGGARELRLRRWGLVPRWAKDASIGSRLINARSETAAEKPAFRDALRRRRCLVPADGFFEWAAASRGPKQPYWIALPERTPFAIAGLFERWTAPEGEVIESCTLLTVAASEGLRAIHQRMPAILPREAWARWLAPDVTGAAEVAPLLAPWSGTPLVPLAVGLRVNRPEHDDPACIAPLADSF